MKQLHAVFNGQIQNVGFRLTASRLAKKLHLSGWVRNLPTGQVELVVEGDEIAIHDLLDQLHDLFAITNSDTVWSAATKQFHGFRVRYS